MRRAAIVAPVRTAVGTFGGSLRPVPVEDLGARVVKAVLDRTGLAPELIEDVVFAQSYANSETLSFPKIISGLDSHCKAESSHH